MLIAPVLSSFVFRKPGHGVAQPGHGLDHERLPRALLQLAIRFRWVTVAVALRRRWLARPG